MDHTEKCGPRQLGTFTSKRSANSAAYTFTASGEQGSDRDTVGHLVNEWVASRVHVAAKTKQQYEWAATHIVAGLGGVRIDRLDREDVARWLEQLASGGVLARRSIVIFRMVLRAALAGAVDDGRLRRSPAARVGMPRSVVKPDRYQEVEAWDEKQLNQFLEAIAEHRWSQPIRLEALYGLRRSELLGLHWKEINLTAATVRIEHALTEVHGRPVWTEGKNARAHRTIPIDHHGCDSQGS